MIVSVQPVDASYVSIARCILVCIKSSVQVTAIALAVQGVSLY